MVVLAPVISRLLLVSNRHAAETVTNALIQVKLRQP